MILYILLIFVYSSPHALNTSEKGRITHQNIFLSWSYIVSCCLVNHNFQMFYSVQIFRGLGPTGIPPPPKKVNGLCIICL